MLTSQLLSMSRGDDPSRLRCSIATAPLLSGSTPSKAAVVVEPSRFTLEENSVSSSRNSTGGCTGSGAAVVFLRTLGRVGMKLGGKRRVAVPVTKKGKQCRL